MIITCRKELQVGKEYSENDLLGNFEFFGKAYPKYRFLVLRNTSEEEYRNYLATVYPDPDAIDSYGFYYEISMD